MDTILFLSWSSIAMMLNDDEYEWWKIHFHIKLQVELSCYDLHINLIKIIQQMREMKSRILILSLEI